MNTNSGQMSLALWIKLNLLADKKKTALMGVLFVVVLAMGAKMILPEPQQAAAQVVTVAPAEAPAEQPVARMSQADPLQGQRRTEYLAKMDRKIDRDLFVADYDAFPLASPVAPVASADEASWADRIRVKLEAADKEAALRQKRLTAQVKSEATALSLQSTMTGSHPNAIINGNVLCLGEKINGFTVSKIGPAQCELVKDGVEVTLLME